MKKESIDNDPNKCDKELPKCSRCMRFDLECSLTAFKPYEFSDNKNGRSRKKASVRKPTVIMLSTELLEERAGDNSGDKGIVTRAFVKSDPLLSSFMNPKAVRSFCMQLVEYPEVLQIPYPLPNNCCTYQPDSFLWSFYVNKTTRFCAVHEFDTPFHTSLIPMAQLFPVLQNALICLSATHWAKTTGTVSNESYDELSSALVVKTIQGLRQQLRKDSLNLDINASIVCISACTSLAAAYIGEGRTDMANVHLNGALNIAFNLTKNSAFDTPSKDSLFVMKWLTYAVTFTNIAATACHTNPLDTKGLRSLLEWWEKVLPLDPESNHSVDLLFGFNLKLAILILKTVVYIAESNNVLHDLDKLEEDLIRACQIAADKCSVTKCCQCDMNLIHCNRSFHSSALLFFYTFLGETSFHSHMITNLVSTTISEIKHIYPDSRYAAAILFSLFIAGSYCEGCDRDFLREYITLMKQQCMSNVDLLSTGLEKIWEFRDNFNWDISYCHLKIRDLGICLY